MPGSIEPLLVEGERYFGIVDWYMSDFTKDRGKGMLYIPITPLKEDRYFRTFEFSDLDIELDRDLNRKLSKPELISTDVVEFTPDLNDRTGYKARSVKFYGTPSFQFVKARLREQEWGFKLKSGKQKPAEKIILKLAVRPKER